MKTAAILGAIGVISLATITYKHQSTPSQEPVISGVETTQTESASPNEGSVLISEPETKTEAPKKSFLAKIADVVVPKTEIEQDAQIEQNTIKNVEQDSQISNLDSRTTNLENKTTELENTINTPPPAPEPEPVCEDQSATNYGEALPCTYPPPPPSPIIKCAALYKTELPLPNGTLYCKNTYPTSATINSVTFDTGNEEYVNGLGNGSCIFTETIQTCPVSIDSKVIRPWKEGDGPQQVFMFGSDAWTTNTARALSVQISVGGETLIIPITAYSSLTTDW